MFNIHAHFKKEINKLVGSIQADDFKENFDISLEYWTVDDYLKQWFNALQRVVNDRKDTLILTWAYPPNINDKFINRGWIFYLEKGIVHIQDHLFISDNVKDTFNLENPYEHIPSRRTKTTDGNIISEWHISYEKIIHFFQEQIQNDKNNFLL